MEKLKCYFSPIFYPRCASTALLILRLIVGIAFIYHGYGKIQNPFGWMGSDVGTPGFFQMLAAVSEFFGGMALVIGLITPLASFGILSTMAVAVYTHKVILGDPFVNTVGGRSYELAMVYFGISLIFMIVGSGKFSLDALIFKERCHTDCCGEKKSDSCCESTEES